MWCSVIYRYSCYINITIGKIDVKCLTSRWSPVWVTAIHLTVAGSVFDGVFLCFQFSHQMSWMRPGT